MVRLVRLVMGGSVKGVASGIDWVTAGDEMNSGETGGKVSVGTCSCWENWEIGGREDNGEGTMKALSSLERTGVEGDGETGSVGELEGLSSLFVGRDLVERRRGGGGGKSE